MVSENYDDKIDQLRYMIFFARPDMYSNSASTTARRDWHADYLEEQKPPVKEVEPDLGFTRISWFEDGRFKVKRVPIVHG